MATTVARIQIPNASMLVANIAAASTYYIPRQAAAGFSQAPLLLTSSATLPAQYVFDVSTYSAIQLIATTAGMTTAAGCVVSAQAILPETSPLPVASLPIPIAGATYTKSCPAIGATASSQSISFNTNADTTQMVTVALTVTFTTLPTAGADLWVYLLGFPWKSYE